MDYKMQTVEKLSQISDGEWRVKKNSVVNSVSHCFSGKGMTELFSIFPGVELSFHSYLTHSLSFHLDTAPSIMKIDYCNHGRMDWKKKDGTVVSLRSGDLLLHKMEQDSKLHLPLGYYEGISISLDLKQQFDSLTEIQKDINISGIKLYELFCSDNKVAVIQKDNRFDSMFSDLYTVPDSIQLPYYKLKILEILLFLSTIPNEIQQNPCSSQQIELIKKIHAQLIHHLDQRFTIETLSKQYLINTSTLKSVFKTVYGLPIASYMKEYRMKKAAQLLRETNDAIVEIAKMVGYESQSKFTLAFKDMFQMLPSEYRKIWRSND